jgi:hypothetical protein
MLSVRTTSAAVIDLPTVGSGLDSRSMREYG